MQAGLPGGKHCISQEAFKIRILLSFWLFLYQMSQDIFQVIEKAKLKNFTLVGFSMGGAIVLRYIRKFKSFGVKKLILLAARSSIMDKKRKNFPYGLTREYVNELIELAETDRPQLCYNFSHEQLFAILSLNRR